ncbi:hypothetical protein CR513_31625, partial [Mucuna pruriens]
MSPYQIVFGKACHLSELEELCLEAYENSQIYKKKVKHYHDSRILRKEFSVGQKDGPFVVTNVFPYGAVEIRDEANNKTFKVNGHQLKPYHEGPNINSTMGEVEIITLVEPVIPKNPPKEVPECIATLRTMQKLRGGGGVLGN